MNKESALELKRFAEKVGNNYSTSDRQGNFNHETFKVERIIPMTDSTATVLYRKNTGKQAAFFFYYIDKGLVKGWKYFVPTDAHILGMESFGRFKLAVEEDNWTYNFESQDA